MEEERKRKWKPPKFEDFTFIASGRSEPSDEDPISENHDETLAKDLYEEMMEKRQEWEEWEREKQNRKDAETKN